MLCEQFGTNSEVFSSSDRQEVLSFLSGVSKSQNNFAAVQSLSLKKKQNTCKEHNVIHDFHACRDRPRAFVSFLWVRKSVGFSLTIIESFRFEDENKYD